MRRVVVKVYYNNNKTLKINTNKVKIKNNNHHQLIKMII